MNKFQRRPQMKSKENYENQAQNSDVIEQTAKKQSQLRQREQRTSKRRSNYQQQIYPQERQQRRPLKTQIQQLYNNFMENSQYTQAEKAKATIKYLNDKEKQKKIRKLSFQQSQQKQAVKQFHQRQVKFFRQAWKQLFMENAMKERMMIQRLQRMRKIDQQQCKQRITRRCQSAKPTVTLSKLDQVQSIQKGLRKRGKTVQLRSIRDQKKRLIKKCRQDQQKTMIKIAEQQRKRMVEKQTRRYRSFMHRIQRERRQNDRIYRREEHRLRQKYKNILQNLEHEQKKDFNQLERSFIV